jgi:hypothetical protein
MGFKRVIQGVTHLSSAIPPQSPQTILHRQNGGQQTSQQEQGMETTGARTRHRISGMVQVNHNDPFQLNFIVHGWVDSPTVSQCEIPGRKAQIILLYVFAL